MVITDEQLPLLVFLIPLLFKGLIYERGKENLAVFLPLISTREEHFIWSRGKTLHVFQKTSGQKSNANHNAHIVKFVTLGHRLSL